MNEKILQRLFHSISVDNKETKTTGQWLCKMHMHRRTKPKRSMNT